MTYNETVESIAVLLVIGIVILVIAYWVGAPLVVLGYTAIVALALVIPGVLIYAFNSDRKIERAVRRAQRKSKSKI